MLNKEQSAGTIAEQGTNADDMHVSPAIGNTTVVGSPSLSKREIKFRAWDKKCMSMHKVRNIEFLLGSITCFGSKFLDCDFNLSGSEAVLMQYIGKKDIHKKDIYEGDIVKWGHEKGGEESPVRIAVVRLDPDIQFHIVNYRMNFLGQNKVFHYGGFIYTATEKWLEVIGNVFENPELLEAVQ